MSTVFSEDFEGGTNGAAVTAGNTSYNTFTNTPTFSSTHAKTGTLSMQLDADGVVTNDSARQDLGVAQSQRWMRRYGYLSALPSSFTTILRVRSTGTSQAQLRINSTGQFVLRDDISALSTTTTATVAAGAFFRYEWKVDDTGNTTELKIFTGGNVDGTTSTETISRAYTGGTFNEILDTNAATSTSSLILWIDGAVDDNAAYPGPAAVTFSVAGAAASTSSASGAVNVPGVTLAVAGVAASSSSAGGNLIQLGSNAGLYAQAVAADRPVGWWRLNETSGTAAADAAGPNPGLYQNGVTLNQGDLLANEVDAAVRLNNTSAAQVQYVRINDSAQTNLSSLSIEMVFQASSWAAGNRLLQKGDSDDQYRLLVSSGLLLWEVAGHASVTAPLPSTTRHHLVVTYDEVTGAAAIYVDGALAGSVVGTPGAAPTTTGNLRIGQKPFSTLLSDGFTGVIDEVVMYGYPLDAGRVATHASAALLLVAPPTTPGFGFGFTGPPFGSTPTPPPPPPPSPDATLVSARPIVEIGFTTTPLVGGGLYLHWDDPQRGLWDQGLWAPDSVWTDVTPWLQSFTYSRGATRVEGPILRYEAGTASIVLNNLDGRFNPLNTTGPYASAGRTQVRPMVPVRIRAQFGDAYYDLWRGFADGWQLDYRAVDYQVVTLSATDAQKVLSAQSRVPRAEGTEVGEGERSGARVNRVLDSVGWPAADRIVDVGETPLIATALGGDAWSELLAVQDTEIGEVFVDATGKLIFRGRYAAMQNTVSASPQAIFGSDIAGGEFYFSTVTPDYDDANIRNVMRVTREGGLEQTASDPSSISQYLEKTHEVSGLLMQTDADALSYGQYLLSLAKDAELRFSQIVVDPRADPVNLFPQVFGRDFGHRITIRKRDLGVPLVEQDALIRGISGEYGGTNRWRFTWELQPADKGQILVWNRGNWDSGSSWAW